MVIFGRAPRILGSCYPLLHTLSRVYRYYHSRKGSIPKEVYPEKQRLSPTMKTITFQNCFVSQYVLEHFISKLYINGVISIRVDALSYRGISKLPKEANCAALSAYETLAYYIFTFLSIPSLL